MSGGAASAEPIKVATLQRLLQDAPRHEVHFTETRESPWLKAPVLSSGTMKATDTALEKRVEEPHREIWRLLADRAQQVDPDTGATKEVSFRNVPAAAALANALRDVMTGDLAALEKDFELVTAGDDRAWTMQLTPRAADVARTLERLEVQGSEGRLQLFVVVESQGGRTTTRLVHD
jgi:hypothetical protein